MKIINISNRLPISISSLEEGGYKLTPASGGLASALSSVDTDNAELMWVGVADFKENDWEEAKNQYGGQYKLEPVYVEENLYKSYYEGFSNSVLWPLFHYFPSYLEFDNRFVEAYQDVNQEIANHVVSLMEDDDIIWVHDYHLFQLPALIRKQKPYAKIGFFLHIPFPAYEVMRILPKKTIKMLIDGVLGADLIGFHTFDYCKHFLETVQIEKGISNEFFKFSYQNRIIKVKAFPISIDYQKFNDSFSLPEVAAERAKLKEQYSDKKIIFSVDRLDYSKGITYRLKGYSRFLELNPDWHNKVVFILVLIPSRTDVDKYSESKQVIDAMVSDINGKMGNFMWTPIVYQFHSLNFAELCGLYTGCDIALISPIRDGMNLVAKEFIAARYDHTGVLMLSYMTGAAKELNEAIQFNPLDEDEISEKLEISLIMSEEEQKSRIVPMQLKIRTLDINYWTKSFLKSLKNIVSSIETIKIDKEELTEIASKYKNAKQRLILLDYDGTLAGFTNDPQDARPRQKVFDIIKRLSENPKNQLAIVSGRDKEFLESSFGKMDVKLIAEHGAFLKTDIWNNTVKDNMPWKMPVQKIMERFVKLSDGSFIEIKEFAVAWHYRKCNVGTGYIKSRELIETLQYFVANSGAKILDGNKVVEVKSAYINKGTAINTMFEISDYDFVIALGDDKTDEDMFRILNQKQGVSVKVGSGNTDAKYRVTDVQQVEDLINTLID